jgi:hypothetical protein
VGWALTRMGEKTNAYRLLVGKPEGKRPLGRTRRRWVDKVKMNLLEIVWGRCRLDWSISGLGQVESPHECGYEPSGSIKCW